MHEMEDGQMFSTSSRKKPRVFRINSKRFAVGNRLNSKNAYHLKLKYQIQKNLKDQLQTVNFAVHKFYISCIYSHNIDGLSNHRICNTGVAKEVQN